MVSALPIISKPLENNPDHLVWEDLYAVDTHRSDDRTRKIPKSIFITPNLNESNCPTDHKLGPDGRCYKTLKIDPLQMLKKQIESLLKSNRTATTEYDEDYDYSEYGESTESMNANNQYTVPLSLGFSSDRKQQQPTHQSPFPHLNRIVKDGVHGPHTNDDKHKQPFLVSTTGSDLDTEANIDESSVSGVASSTVPPNTTAAITIETTPNFKTSTIASTSITPSITEKIESTVASTTLDSVESAPSSSEASPTSNSTDDVATASMKSSTVSSTSLRNAPTDDDNITEAANETEIATTTNAVDVADSQLTPTIENVEVPENMSTSTAAESIESSTNSMIIDTTQSNSNLSPTEDTVLQTSTKAPMESIETQNESAQPKLTAMDHTSAKQESVDLPEKRVKIIEPSANRTDPSPNETVKATVSVSDKVIIIQAQSVIEPSTTTEAVASKSEAYEVVDAYFIPSQSEISDEIDTVVGKSLNSSMAEPRYRFENMTVSDDEAEIAPIIDTGNDGRSNIELIKELDEVAHSLYEDDKKNLSARLAEESLLGTRAADVTNTDDEVDDFALQMNDRKTEIEEALNGVSFEIGSNASRDVTTEEPIEYDSKEVPSEPVNSTGETNIKYAGDLPEREAIRFDREKSIEGTPPPAQVPPSVYATFVQQLKSASPFAELNDQQPEAVQYSHTPFDIAAPIPDQSAIELGTTHATFTQPAADQFDTAAEPNGKSLHIGIKCYLSLANKQQFIICDDE